MAQRVAAELPDGSYVNLGIGLPTLVADHLPPDREVVFHCENGLIGTGPHVQPGQGHPYLIDASSSRIVLKPGAAVVGHDVSFAIARGGHLDATVLGALQVSERGDLANWLVPGRRLGGMGGAMDLAVGARRVYVMMRHVDPQGRPKIVRRCDYPLTAPACVDLIITDLAVIEVTESGLLVRDTAPGVTFEYLQSLTEPPLRDRRSSLRSEP
jgi:3-oxoacid CoA-transferase B subunit